MPRVRALAATLAVASLAAAPRVAEACSVCMSGRDDETRTAFIVTTAFMTFLPLTLGTAIFLWLRRRYRAMEREEAEDARDAGAVAAPDAVRISSSTR